ncbi:MAG: hypothetical protein M0Q91_05480 [Methanoregula sp.]|nr:hypothetical protein [Methanoregula sp.]
MSEQRQIVKVRRVGKNAEQVLHAPSVISGHYWMSYDEKTGVIRYEPVKVT